MLKLTQCIFSSTYDSDREKLHRILIAKLFVKADVDLTI